MQYPRQARSGIGGDRAQIEEYWQLGCKVLNLPGNDLSVSCRDESARGPCTCAVEVDWGADAMRGRPEANSRTHRPEDTQ
jgi:hypothetical protein